MRIQDTGQTEDRELPSGEQIHSIVDVLQQALGDRLVALVLFGSRARGDAQPDSDWDLLLIAKNLPQQAFARHQYIKNMLPTDWRGRLGILAKTPAEFDSYLPALFLDIAVDGIVLWDVSGYMTSRLASLRQLLARQGLHRERRNGDFVWQWQGFPGFDWRLTWEDAR